MDVIWAPLAPVPPPFKGWSPRYRLTSTTMSTNNETPSVSVTDLSNDQKPSLPLPRPGPGARLPSLTQLAARQVLPLISSSADLIESVVIYGVTLGRHI